jgi:hypothetical protein
MFSGRTGRFEHWETTAKQKFDQIFNAYLNTLENEWQDLKSNVECGQKSNVGRCSAHSVHFPLFTNSIVGLKQTFDSMRTKLWLHQLFSFHQFHCQFSNHNDYRWLHSTREVECPISLSLEDMETGMMAFPLQSMNDLHRQSLTLNSIGDCQSGLPWKSIISAFQHVRLFQPDLQRAERSKW